MSAGSDRAAKDKSMAAFLKKHGVIRTTTACPHCHRPTGLNALMLAHMINCRGRSRGRIAQR